MHCTNRQLLLAHLKNIAQGPHLESAAAEYSLQFKQFLFGFTDLWMYESALPWTLLGFT